MTRDQALAIMRNLPIIDAFAKGKKIVQKINGRPFEARVLVLSNFKSDRPIGYEVDEDPYEFQH